MTTDVANRYRIEAILGEGGMGAVYRAFDLVTDRSVALKRLLSSQSHHRERRQSLFEREFHTLAQISHPSIIEAYDYGVDDIGPYYTMELLAGDDLQRLAPLSYRRACALLHGVASALALLHSRRLVHRDVTHRNIFVVGKERAKLIDFGALLPMGPCEDVVGTPAFVAPESVLMQPLDGRTDLYSVGVVLYHALTGEVPYRARTIADLRAAWLHVPTPPSRYVEGLPPELDRLTLSLIALDRTARPRDAAEVMDRLATIASLRNAEPPAASRAYLVAPMLVGRGDALSRVRDVLRRTIRGHGASVVVTGKAGVGRSRMLDACVLEAKVLGATVLRARATGRAGAFRVARALVQQLLDAMPHLPEAFARKHPSDFSILFDSEQESSRRLQPFNVRTKRQKVIVALRRLLLTACAERCLVVTLDDLYELDEPSIATLAILLSDAPTNKLLILAAVNSDGTPPNPRAFRQFTERSEALELVPLGFEPMRDLLGSIFGSAPHLETVTSRIHRLSQGNPRDAITLAEHLVDRKLIRYDAGRWVLPSQLDTNALPASISEALKDRLASLSRLARSLATAQALAAPRTLTLDQYHRLAPTVDAREVHAAIDELVAWDILITEGHSYSLKHEGWISAFTGGLTPAETREHHIALARMHDAGGEDRLSTAHHLFLAGEAERALDLLEPFALGYAGQVGDVFEVTNLGSTEVGKMFGMAVDASQRLRRSRRVQAALRRLFTGLGVFVDASWFTESAPLVLANLKKDSGYLIWQSFPPDMDPKERVMEALRAAHAQYESTPAEERIFTPAQAVKLLVQFAVAAIAIGARTQNWDLQRSLPGLLVPFAPLSPIIEAILEDCRATSDVTYGRNEQCRDCYRRVLDKLTHVDVSALEHADEIRDAVTYGIGVSEMRLGIPTATEWLERVSDNPRHAGTALVVRSIICLQQGDWARARQYKQQAEQFDLEHDVKQIFGHSTLKAELDAYALGLDLGAVKQIAGQMEALAAVYPGWSALAHQARGEYNRLRGDLEGALAEFERCIRLSEPRFREECPDVAWYSAAAGKIEILVDLGRCAEAKAWAEDALRYSGGSPTGTRYDGVRRALALAEAKLGRFDAARSRIFELIEGRLRLGTTGVYLALLYEALTLISIWAGDVDEFGRYAGLTAQQYLRSADSGFGGRYKRLLETAHREGIAEGDPPQSAVTAAPNSSILASRTVESSSDARERAERGLALLCERAGAKGGYLYLLRDSGLELVSSLSSGDPEQDLEAYLRQLMRKEMDASQMKTVADADRIVTELFGSADVWTSKQSQSYRIVTIRACFGAASSPIGLAALHFEGSADAPAGLARLAAALGDYFL